VTASRDGTIALRCLRSSFLLKIIPVDKLSSASVDMLTLKLSLHGYIIIMLKGTQKVYTFVYSLNGDLLVSTQRDSEHFEFKYAQLTQNEDSLVMAFNQRIKSQDKDFSGVIRVSRLYDMEKDKRRDNLERVFYPVIRNLLYGPLEGEGGHRSKSKRTVALSENSSMQQRLAMPAITSFALSQDETQMNLFLKTGDIISLDESRCGIIDQLDDFGL